jgi:8-oxo-dGTP diphosphatase
MMKVCCAVIIRDGKMLAVQKGPKSSHPWKWEFPGGKIHPMESPVQCIVREIEEELMIRITILQQLESIEFDYGLKPLCLIPFVSHILSGEIQLTEHANMRWMDLKEWESLDWAEADRQLIIKNKEQLSTLLD